MTKEVLIQLSKLITIFLNKVKLPCVGEYKTKRRKTVVILEMHSAA